MFPRYGLGVTYLLCVVPHTFAVPPRPPLGHACLPRASFAPPLSRAIRRECPSHLCWVTPPPSRRLRLLVHHAVRVLSAVFSSPPSCSSTTVSASRTSSPSTRSCQPATHVFRTCASSCRLLVALYCIAHVLHATPHLPAVHEFGLFLWVILALRPSSSSQTAYIPS